MLIVHQRMSRTTSLLLSGFAVFSTSVFAQAVDFVYPRFVVAGTTTAFTAVGSDLSPASKRSAVLKHRFAKPAVCTDPKIHKPQTKKRYYFTCTLQSEPKLAKLHISSVSKKSGSTALWDGDIQVLNAPPSIKTVTVVSDALDGQSQVSCQPMKPCLITAGKLEANQSIRVEIEGQNLPASLQWSVGGCRSLSNWGNPSNTTTLKFDCNSVIAGQNTLSILTAPKSEGGVAIYTATLPFGTP